MCVRQFLFIFGVFAVCSSATSFSILDLVPAASNILHTPNNESNGQLGKILLDAVLHSKGTSLPKIQLKLFLSRGNVEEAIDAINGELKTNLFEIVNDEVRINADGLVAGILTTSEYFLNKFGNSNLAKDVQNNLEVALEEILPIVKAVLDKSTVTVEEVREALAQRLYRRSVAPRESLLEKFFGKIFKNLRTVLANLLRVVQGRIDDVLSSGSNVIAKYYIDSEPDDIIGKLLARVVNKLIPNAVKYVEDLRYNVTKYLDGVINSIEGESSLKVRVVRDLKSEDSTSVVSRPGILDVILIPLTTILKLVVALLHNVLMVPIGLLMAILRPLVGNNVLTPLHNLLKALINNLLPCSTCIQ